MAITTYAELQTAVNSWLHRANLAALVPDFITIGESRLNRELRLFSMENSASLTTSTSDRFATLPTGFLEAIDLALYADEYPQTLTQVPLSEINARGTTVAGMPRFYAVSSNIVFDVKSDRAYDLVLRYMKKLDIATELTNAVLTNFPDLYLYSALLAAEPYTKNDKRIGVWASLLKDGIQSANRLDGKTRGKAMLVTEVGMLAGRRSNILTGEP